MPPVPKRRLLAIAKPPKPISEMTDAERYAFAQALYERMASNFKHPDTDEGDRRGDTVN